MDKITEKEKVRQKAERILMESLKEKKLRKTPERIAILNAIYDFDEYFSIEQLQDKVKEIYNYHVSLSTYYNTLNLFMEFSLVLKCPFGKSSTYFEKAIGNTFTFYKVCNNCGKIVPFKNKKLAEHLADIKNSRFTSYNFNTCFYGLCSKCARKLNKKLKKELEKTI